MCNLPPFVSGGICLAEWCPCPAPHMCWLLPPVSGPVLGTEDVAVNAACGNPTVGTLLRRHREWGVR